MKRWPAIVFLLAAAPALAHDTWLLPSRSPAGPGASLVFELTSAMDFPKPETPVSPERLVASRVRLAGRTRELRAEPQPTFLKLSAVLGHVGVATAWVETRPRTLDLTPAEVAEYLEEIGETDTIGAEWRRSGGKVWRETYVKFAKTHARLGDPAEDRSWAEPLGLAFEIVAEVDPTRLETGATLPLRVLFHGEPAAGQAVGAVAAGSPAALQRTDAQGRVSFVLNRPGPWLIRATRIRAAGGEPGVWDSHFTTLTVSVGPPVARD